MRDPLQRLNLAPGERRLVLLIMVIAFLVVNYWFVWPRFGEWGQLGFQLETSRQKLETQRREAERLEFYQASLQKLESQAGVVPRGEEATAFLATVQALARERNLPVYNWGNVATPRTGPGATNQFFEERTLTLRANPNEEVLVDFLHRLSSANSAFRVRDLTLRPGPNDARSGGPTNLDATITIVASYQRARPAQPPTALSSGATNLAASTPPPR